MEHMTLKEKEPICGYFNALISGDDGLRPATAAELTCRKFEIKYRAPCILRSWAEQVEAWRASPVRREDAKKISPPRSQKNHQALGGRVEVLEAKVAELEKRWEWLSGQD